MPSESYVYSTYPLEIVSNTHDFDVRWVVHNGQRMRGVFARRTISNSECSLFMGTYPGYRKKKEEIARKVANYVTHNSVNYLSGVRKTVAYVLSLREHNPGYVLDPTDDNGDLYPEFENYLVCYINEPPPKFPSKSAFVFNLPRQRYEVWLLKAIEKDEEVYLFYGKKYFRDYPINPNSCDDKIFHFIPSNSIFNLDSRGIPAMLQVPKDGNEIGITNKCL